MDPISSAATSGLSELTQYGIAGVCILILLCAGAFMLRWFMDQFKKCHENSNAVIDKNTVAFHSLEIALVKLESKLEK